MNDLATIKIVLGLQGRSNWHPGLNTCIHIQCVYNWMGGVIRTA